MMRLFRACCWPPRETKQDHANDEYIFPYITEQTPILWKRTTVPVKPRPRPECVPPLDLTKVKPNF